jgi:hypothetical protein
MQKLYTTACAVAQLTASEISVLKIKAYLEDQYAQEVWAPDKFERGRKDFKPSWPVLGQLRASYADEGLEAITQTICLS